MGIGVSVFLMALGGILTWGINVDTAEGFNINSIGVILMVVGAIGLVLSVLFWSSFSPRRRRETVVERDREVL